ncbi:uncharacterized protein METZ01_LOCUS238631, partial [marine metagenome]
QSEGLRLLSGWLPGGFLRRSTAHLGV